MRLMVAVAVVLTVAAVAYGGVRLLEPAGAAGSNADAMSIDMDPAAAPANSGSSFGTIESCARINENDTLDADEDAMDVLRIDVVIDSIPEGTAAIGTAFTLEFPMPGVTVAQGSIPYATEHGWSVINASDSPQSDGTFLHSVVDLFTAGAAGSGTISGLTLETAPGVATGVFPLTLTEARHIDGLNKEHFPDAINDASVAINQACPEGTATPTSSSTPTPTGDGTPTATPTSTPTPTPTAGGSPTPTLSPTPTENPVAMRMGDLDCDGDVDAVDALKGLQSVAGIDYQQQPGCPPIGTASAFPFGDVDCDGDADAVDSLQILRFIAGLPVTQSDGCPDIGAPL